MCPLSFDSPAGGFYSSWLDAGGENTAARWAQIVLGGDHGGDPGVHDLARRMPYFSSVYGRMIPAGAAYHLDRRLDEGSVPVRWTPGGPVTRVPAAAVAPPLTSGSAAEARAAIHDLHARGFLMVTDDGIVVPVVPAQTPALI